MACDITAGRAKVCKDGLGGTSVLYLWNEIANPFTVAAGVCTAVSVSLTTVYAFPLEGDGGSLVQSLVSDRNTGSSVCTQTITAALKKSDAATSANLSLLAYGFPSAVIKDRNGIYHAVSINKDGSTDGIDFTIEENTGGAKTDMNGYTLTGVATTNTLAPKLDSATTTAFLALV